MAKLSVNMEITSSSSSSSAAASLSPFNLRTMLYFGLWYFFNVLYNIANKKFLEVIPLPVTVAFLQTLLGIPVFAMSWMVRPQTIPKYNINKDLKNSLLVSSCHAMGQLTSVISFSMGSVSFIHVVKSAEPIVAALLSRFFMNQTLPLFAYLSLLLIAVGVAVTSSTEISFSWTIFGIAMASNVFYQLRMVLAKKDMTPSSSDEEEEDFGGAKQEKISASNMFRIITLISTVLLLPLALFYDGLEIISMWKAAVASDKATNYFLISQLVMSGLSYYIYNEVAFWILEVVQPVTHAVGNSLKRIVLIASSIIFLANPVTFVGLIGALIAISGTLLYSLATISSKNF